MKFIDLTGQKFGRLVIINEKGNDKYGHIKLNCRCECGNEKIILMTDLINNKTKSCGCLRNEKTIERNKLRSTKTHGMSGTKIYNVFRSAKQRCNNPNNKDYKSYGKRGIKFEWKSFEEFNRDMGESYNEHKKNNLYTSLERIDNNGNYCKNNCCFKSIKEQSNNKRNNIFITYKGKKQTLTQWAEELNINYNTFKARICRYKWSIKKAIETKV